MAKCNMCTCDVRSLTKLIQGLIMEIGKEKNENKKPCRKAGNNKCFDTLLMQMSHESCNECTHMETHL